VTDLALRPQAWQARGTVLSRRDQQPWRMNVAHRQGISCSTCRMRRLVRTHERTGGRSRPDRAGRGGVAGRVVPGRPARRRGPPAHRPGPARAARAGRARPRRRAPTTAPSDAETHDSSTSSVGSTVARAQGMSGSSRGAVTRTKPQARGSDRSACPRCRTSPLPSTRRGMERTWNWGRRGS
jgi:hypothetical protein